MIDKLLAYRAEFPILSSTTYLVSNSLGAMPRGVPERLAEYVDEWAELGVRAWARGWWEMPVTVGDEVAPLLGAGTGEVAMIPNVTMAQATVLSALDYTPPRDTIVMTALDFPSVRYVYDRLATRFGARIKVVESDDGIAVDTQRVIDAIDERTRLVSISHVLFRSAYVMDVDAICRAARAAGALVSLDAFHAVGVIPVDVRRSGADFVTGGVLKWLCGGPGACFLYVAPAVRDTLEPALGLARALHGVDAQRAVLRGQRLGTRFDLGRALLDEQNAITLVHSLWSLLAFPGNGPRPRPRALSLFGSSRLPHDSSGTWIEPDADCPLWLSTLPNDEYLGVGSELVVVAP